MLTYRESVLRFNELKAQLRIPADADFTFVEKRHIEQFPTGEIEAMEGAPAAPIEEGGDGPGNSGSEITNRLAWVGEFSLGFMFWELAIDARGSLVRLRKSR